MNPRIRDLLLALTWFLLDQATKFWASSGVLATPMQIFPDCLRFSLSHNTGALFGFLSQMADPWRSIILIALPVGAVVIISVMLWRVPLRDRWVRVALALILGGAIGNLTDRVLYGYVVDFIDVYAGWPAMSAWFVETFGTNRWPTFNVADMGLCCGASVLLIEVVRDAFKGRRRKETPGAPAAD